MKTFVILVLSLMVLALPGCGSDHYNPLPLFDTQILSDPALDGDIAVPVLGPVIIAQGSSQSYFAGIDPADGAELRTFLQFPLGSVNGVPVDAVIESATLDLLIKSITPNPLGRSIPIRIDLVNLQPPTLFPNDFDITPALVTTTVYKPISQSGQHVFMDVTSLMREAQYLRLPRFQVRILVDPGAATSWFIEINDSTGVNRSVQAPLLDVSYY